MAHKISPAEWEVLNVLWQQPSATAAEVCAALAGEQEWHPKTVGTFLTRLAGKGLVKVRRAGKANVYVPAKSRAQCIRAEGDSFLRRIFRGSCGPMLLHFVERAELSPAEIRELERALKQKKTKP